MKIERNYLGRIYLLKILDDGDNTICDIGFVKEGASHLLRETAQYCIERKGEEAGIRSRVLRYSPNGHPQVFQESSCRRHCSASQYMLAERRKVSFLTCKLGWSGKTEKIKINIQVIIKRHRLLVTRVKKQEPVGGTCKAIS